MKNSNIILNENAIREAAYFIWKNNGCPANTSAQDWNAAINQLSSLATLNKAAKKVSSCKTSSLVKKDPRLKPLPKPLQRRNLNNSQVVW